MSNSKKSTFKLFQLTFNFEGVLCTCEEVPILDVSICERPNLQACVDIINKDVRRWCLDKESDLVYFISAQDVMKYYGDTTTNLDSDQVNFLNSVQYNIICGFGVDADEADTYVLIKFD